METFIIPWRYKNKRTAEISWKIYHLSSDKINGAGIAIYSLIYLENETIIVNPARDRKMKAVIEYVVKNHHKFVSLFANYNLDIPEEVSWSNSYSRLSRRRLAITD
jgi:hypothetical protein